MISFARRVVRKIRWIYKKTKARLFPLPLHPPIEQLSDWNSKFPFGVTLEPTTACNAKCVFCPVSIRTDDFVTHHLENDVLASLLEELKNLPRDMEGYVQFVGLGEPTISKNFTENIAKLREVAPDSFEIRLNTNGTTLHNEKIMKAIVDNVQFLTISINGYDEPTYQLLNGIPGFEKTIDKVQNFLKMKNIEGHGQPCTRVQIMNSNQFDRKKFRRFTEEFGEWVVEPDIFHIQELMTLKTVEDPIQEIMSDEDRKREESIEHREIPCFQMRYHTFVCADGDAYPCCIVGNLDGREARQETGLCLGNINDSTIEEIWNGSKRQELLEQDVSGTRPSFCSKCSDLSIYNMNDWQELRDHIVANEGKEVAPHSATPCD